MNEYKEALLNQIDNKECPECNLKDIGVDNWGMFEGERDWFYYCKECDYTFR